MHALGCCLSTAHTQIDFSVPCRMLKIWPCNFLSCSGSFSPASWLYSASGCLEVVLVSKG